MEIQDIITNRLLSELASNIELFPFTNTVIFNCKGLKKTEKDKLIEYLEVKLSNLCCRDIHVAIEDPTPEHPNNSFHLAYFSENDPSEDKLTLEDVFKNCSK